MNRVFFSSFLSPFFLSFLFLITKDERGINCNVLPARRPLERQTFLSRGVAAFQDSDFNTAVPSKRYDYGLSLTNLRVRE